ncbi:MAG: 50S ribosomal protein L23 [Planctomycetes bacterium]|nr:50S ribosomal protein L23 [Planctomycetota bacterium]
MIGIYDVVRKPLITERATSALDRSNTYVFDVHPAANKVQIKNAIEKLFNVKVLSVNTANRKGKVKARRSGRKQLMVELASRKKAYVRLRAGDAIELF